MKTGKFRRVNMAISLSSARGYYLIEARYKGEDILCGTSDSESWDNMDSPVKNKRMDALRHCYYKVLEAYDRIKHSI